MYRQSGGLNSMLRGYTAGSSTKEKRIGVPFAPSQSVNISAQASSSLSPFANTTVTAESSRESGNQVI